MIYIGIKRTNMKSKILILLVMLTLCTSCLKPFSSCPQRSNERLEFMVGKSTKSSSNKIKKRYAKKKRGWSKETRKKMRMRRK